jgi:hypothetical protein
MSDLLGRWRKAQGSHSGFLMLVTSQSLYEPSVPTYRFVFGSHPAHESRTQAANIVGTAEMRVFHPEREKKRLLKMMLRYVGVRVCRLSYNHDPKSVMYDSILSDADLDRMVANLPRRC